MRKIYDEKSLLEFLDSTPTAFHFSGKFENELLKSGFENLMRKDAPKIQRGGAYYIKSGSAIIALRVPERVMAVDIIASHSDSPLLKIKHNPEVDSQTGLIRLNTEPYGGFIYSLYFDRPLSIAGRVYGKCGKKIEMRDVDFKENRFVIPSLAVHFNRDGKKMSDISAQRELLPIFGEKDNVSFLSSVSQKSGFKESEILDWDLFLYPAERGFIWADGSFITSPRLDDMELSYLSMRSLIDSTPQEKIAISAVFNSEETGSSTRDGALSDLLKNLMERIFRDLNISFEERDSIMENSILISADNGHATHPAYTDKHDITNISKLNGGVLLKYSAGTSYSTTGETGSYLIDIMREKGIKYQIFHNSSDEKGGSTLGSLSMRKLSIKTADIGLSLLSMHSPLETGGVEDIHEVSRLFKAIYSL